MRNDILQQDTAYRKALVLDSGGKYVMWNRAGKVPLNSVKIAV